MKFHDLLGVTGFALLIAATWLSWGLAPSMAVAGGGLLTTALLIARNGGR